MEPRTSGNNRQASFSYLTNLTSIHIVSKHRPEKTQPCATFFLWLSRLAVNLFFSLEFYFKSKSVQEIALGTHQQGCIISFGDFHVQVLFFVMVYFLFQVVFEFSLGWFCIA